MIMFLIDYEKIIPVSIFVGTHVTGVGRVRIVLVGLSEIFVVEVQHIYLREMTSDK